MHQIPSYFKEELCDILQLELYHTKKFNSSSKSSSKRFQNCKLVISPKKKDMNTLSTNEKTGIYSIKKNDYNKKRENNNNYRSICRKLDFSDNSENNNNNSNYSISDNENIEINEDYSEDSNEDKNLEYSSYSFGDGKTKKKSKNNKNKKEYYYTEKEFNFIKRKKFSDDITFYSNNSKFDEEYVILKTLCNGEMGTVYLCLRIKDKKK